MSEGEIPGVGDVICVNALTGVAFVYEAPSKVQATDALERWETYPLTERCHQTGVPISQVAGFFSMRWNWSDSDFMYNFDFPTIHK